MRLEEQCAHGCATSSIKPLPIILLSSLDPGRNRSQRRVEADVEVSRGSNFVRVLTDWNVNYTMPPTRAISEDAQSREDAARTLEPPTKKARLSAEPAGGLPSSDQPSTLGSSKQEPPPDEDEWKEEVLTEPEDDVNRRSDLYLDTVRKPPPRIVPA